MRCFDRVEARLSHRGGARTLQFCHGGAWHVDAVGRVWVAHHNSMAGRVEFTGSMPLAVFESRWEGAVVPVTIGAYGVRPGDLTLRGAPVRRHRGHFSRSVYWRGGVCMHERDGHAVVARVDGRTGAVVFGGPVALDEFDDAWARVDAPVMVPACGGAWRPEVGDV